MSALRDEDERTIFQPLVSEPGVATGAPVSDPAFGRGGLMVGTLLNNIYEVRRFLARGGMGEVFEGVNVNTDERVAIKVMLPHLAADPKVQAMFRKEARILTELAHPALVRYRVLAQEPQLGLFYIVTEFIDGRSLSDLLGELKSSPAQLQALMRRLAEGLGAAHALGAIHRDISPDNVLLPQGRLELAKIIDFGIARETSLSHQTVVGDSFAGKLGYVAPEQFGDFGRRIGPWTDVYRLGLVGLALAAGRAPDMGVTLVDAVDRRREGVDLSPLPAALKPVFAKMLAPDPSSRFQSMAEVIVAFDALDAPKTAPPVATATIPPLAPPDEALEDRPPPSLKPWLIGAGAMALASVGALVAIIGFAGGPRPSPANIVPIAETPPVAETAPAPPVQPPVQPQLAPIAATPDTTVLAPVHPPVPLSKPTPTKPVAPRPVAPVPSASTSLPAPEALSPAPAPIAAPETKAQPVAAAAPAAAAAAAATADKAVQACYRATGGSWTYLGYASRPSCVAQAFNTCDVVNGRWGDTQLRRYDGKIEAKGSGFLSRWRAAAPSDCPAPADAGR